MLIHSLIRAKQVITKSNIGHLYGFCITRIDHEGKFLSSFPMKQIRTGQSAFLMRSIRSMLTNKICTNFTSSSNPSQVPLLQEIQAKILQIVKKCKPSLSQGQLERNTKFDTVGIDSLEVMEMVVAMEQSFAVQLSDEQALRIDSLGSAIDIFFSKINARIMNKMVEKIKEEVVNPNP